MKRRFRILLMIMLTGIWLCVQSPFAHAQRMQTETTAVHVMHSVAVEPPCHGDPAPAAAPVDTHADDSDCCTAGHCDGQCTALAWALPAPISQLCMRGAAWLTPARVAGLQLVDQPEPFRPPI